MIRVAVIGIASGGAFAYALADSGAALDGLVLDTTPIYLEPDLPGKVQGRVLMLVGAENSSLAGPQREKIEQAFRRPGIVFEWRSIPAAGAPLLDPQALGFSRAAYDAAVDAVAEFARGLAAR